jgi:hypothetical protein
LRPIFWLRLTETEAQKKEAIMKTKSVAKAAKQHRKQYRYQFPGYDHWDCEVDEFRLDTPMELEDGTVIMRPACTITLNSMTRRVVDAYIGW